MSQVQVFADSDFHKDIKAPLETGGTVEHKRAIARQLGNYWFNNGQLEIELNKLFVPVRSEFKKLAEQYLKIEPAKTASVNLLPELPAAEFTMWRATLQKYRTFILKNDLYLPRMDDPEKLIAL